MFDIDWTNLQLYHYLAIGGGAVAVLALIMYFVMPKGGVRIPAGVLGTVGGLVAGVGIGVIGMAAYGYQFTMGDGGDGAAAEEGGPPGGMKGPEGMGGKGMPGGMPPGMPGMPGMGGDKGGGKGKGGFGPPNDKAQLVTLIGKLDQLTGSPLTLKLSDEQRTVIREQLKDLPEHDEVSDEDAKKRLDAILESLKDHRAVLEAAGYRWPGAPAPKTGGLAPPNPFKGGPDSVKLHSLQEKLKK